MSRHCGSSCAKRLNSSSFAGWRQPAGMAAGTVYAMFSRREQGSALDCPAVNQRKGERAMSGAELSDLELEQVSAGKVYSGPGYGWGGPPYGWGGGPY